MNATSPPPKYVGRWSGEWSGVTTEKDHQNGFIDTTIYVDGSVHGSIRNETLAIDGTLDGTVGSAGNFTGYYRFKSNEDTLTYVISGQLVTDQRLVGHLRIAADGEDMGDMDFSLQRAQ